METDLTPNPEHASPPVSESECCKSPFATRILHALDYDDGTSVVTTYEATYCTGCHRDTDRRQTDQRRGMEERLPIGETIILPTFLRELRARFAA